MSKQKSKTEAAVEDAILIGDVVTIQINGMPFDEAAVLAMPDGAAIWAQGLEQKAGLAQRDQIRAAITKEVGDTEAILGTTADVTQLNAAAVLALIAACKAGDTFPKFRSAFMQTIEALVPATDGGDDVYTQAQQFLGGVQSGDIILTAALKGLPEVISEMAGRSTGVAHILSQAKASAK